MFTHILVPLDGTPHSDKLVIHARELAVLTGATVHLLHVNVHEWIEGQDLTMEDTTASVTYLDHAQRTLTAAGITVSGEALTADSRDITNAILQRITPTADHLIIVGAPHHTPWARLLGKNISDQIAHTAGCPILLIP